MRSIRMIAIWTTLALLIGMLSGCMPQQDEETPTVPTAPDGTVITTTAAAAPEAVWQNPITGREDMNGSTSDRPVGIMIANNDFMQGEQVGICDADMWMETETEAGITRIMAVFANTERVPSAIGPIRSARSPFVHVVDALDIAYAHAGGSYPALSLLSYVDGVGNIDLDDSGAGDYCWRDEDYPHDYEFRLRTSGEKLTNYMQDHDYSMQALRDIPWTHGTPTGKACGHVQIRMSDAQIISFEYDSASGSYNKYNGYSETRHSDINGKPLQTENVLILYTDRYNETDATIDFYLENGTGYVFSGGLTRRFEWSRGDDGFTMTEEDGSPLTLATGRVYLCVVGAHFEDELTIG